MLFQRLYNWIKYKTLPASFLFKNRLFIERDSKHRRILSNFGLSFRNSKWTNYETNNIKLQFKKSYFRIIFWILFFFLILTFLLYFKKYYIFFYFFNNVYFIFWIGIDTFDYYLTFFVWIALILSSILFKLIHSYFFFNTFPFNSSNQEKFFNKSSFNLNLNNSLPIEDLKISKHDLNWLLYSWLLNPNSKNNNIILEKIFENKINKELWNNNYDFFIKLYKVSYFLNLINNNSNVYNLNTILNNLSNKYYKGDYLKTLNFFNNNFLLNNYSSWILFYFLKNYNNYFDYKNKINNSLLFLNSKNEWNLYSSIKEIENYPFLIKNKIGTFYLEDINYQKFSHFIFNYNELWSLNLYLKNQITASKWNRWLYRYSILHRKILKNSHKITLAKRLINSGFYDSRIFNKNIWAAEHLSFIENKNLFTSFFFNYYKNLFSMNNIDSLSQKSLILNNGNQKNSLSLSSFYENSYFWYLKRFYLFNTLSNNSIKSSLKSFNFNQNFENNNINSEFSKFNYLNQMFLNFYLKTDNNNLSLFSHFNYNLFSSSVLKQNENSYKENFKNYYLMNNENDILSKDNLNLFHWISSNSNKNNNLIFFNYFNSQNLSDNSFNSTFYNNNKSLNNNLFLLYFWLNRSLNYSIIKQTHNCVNFL